MNNNWNQSGNRFDIGDVSTLKPKLDKGIYSLEKDPMTGQLYLQKLEDKFEFGYKMYGIQEPFINRVVKTFHSTKGNLGTLLNGVKGTGKSVTAKVLANELGLPVILINKGYGGIPDFLNSIQQEVTVFADEFEKIFDEKDGSILTVMDGVLDNGFRRVFLLTTNHLRVNENLLSRPGRIRYLQTYSDLSKEIIEMIVDDCLQHIEHREGTINFISTLELITVDIVKAVISEVNIHNEDPKVFKDVFNVKQRNEKVYTYLVDGNKETLINTNNNSSEFKNIFDNDNPFYYGYLRDIGDVSLKDVISKEDKIFSVIEDELEEGQPVKRVFTLRMEKAQSYHSSFVF